jgi:hypothetical protein
MKSQQRSTIVGVFEDRRQVNQAIEELCEAGFRKDQIGVALRQAEGALDAAMHQAEGAIHAGTAHTETHPSSRILAETLDELGLGGLTGLRVLAGVIPAVGSAIAGGTLCVILSNETAGASIGGLAGALAGAGIPEEEARYYQGEFEAGRTMVTVHAEGYAERATAILRRHGAYDLSTRHGGARATDTASRAADKRATAASARKPATKSKPRKSATKSKH